jgi:FK506-binding nuclear protein
MAAIDPSEPAEIDENATETKRPRATLKIIRQADGDDDEDREEYMRALLGESDSESEDESDDDEEEANGGPSDPSKSKKARKAAALKQLMESIDAASESDEQMEDAAAGVNGAAKSDKKGKAKATSDDEDDEDEDSDDEDLEIEEFVLCTLDPEKASRSMPHLVLLTLTFMQNFQQPLDITIAENERVFFKVSGTHTIYLTGNYVVPDDEGHNHHHEVYDSDSDEDGDYDLSPDEDELELELDDEESDDLDGLEDPRITEVESDEEEAPKLVKADKKGKNKRSADEIEEGNSLDDIMAKSLKPEAGDETKLSKKQLKKLKKNNGEATASKVVEQTKDSASAKGDKKVQFAKNLEQGPSGSAKATETAAASGPRTVQGVKIDDKKSGKGPACKKGDKVGMRYIGKLVDGKVFDCTSHNYFLSVFHC